MQAVDAPEQGGAGPRRDKVVLCLRFSVCGSVFAVLSWLYGSWVHKQLASIEFDVFCDAKEVIECHRRSEEAQVSLQNPIQIIVI